MDAFAAARLVIGTGFLLAASGLDLRTRKVPDRLWIALGSLGLILIAAELFLEQAEIASAGLVASAALLFYAIFFGSPIVEEDRLHRRPARLAMFFVAAALFALPAALHFARGEGLPQRTLELYSMPLMVVVYQGFYAARLLHGGADAKGLIALTLLVPLYPRADPFPLSTPGPSLETALRVTIPFSLGFWANAALLFLAVPIGLFVVNVIRGDVAFPQAFLGYRARTSPFPQHVWLMEKINARGEHLLVLYPKRGVDPTADLARLREAGIDRVWVTPQIPFMVPLLGGFLIAFFVGNLLLAILPFAG